MFHVGDPSILHAPAHTSLGQSIQITICLLVWWIFGCFELPINIYNIFILAKLLDLILCEMLNMLDVHVGHFGYGSSLVLNPALRATEAGSVGRIIGVVF